MCDSLLVDKNLIGSLENENHVWFCRPDEITDQTKYNDYLSILSNEEREKYRRFHFDKDRHSYLISHVLVRKTLSRYCEVLPEKWQFTFNQHGKPEISPEVQCSNLKFNLSHTDGMSACVVTLESDCGVDVENIHRNNKLDAVAKRMFAGKELEVILNSDGENKQKNFFNFWTLREAYVKALGTGLGGSSKEFHFTIDAANANDKKMSRAEINFVDSYKADELEWQFFLLEPSSSHIAAIVVSAAGAVLNKTTKLFYTEVNDYDCYRNFFSAQRN